MSAANMEICRLALAALNRKERAEIAREMVPSAQPGPVARAAGPAVYSVKRTAAAFDKSVRLCHKLAAEGLLVRVTLPGRKQACGFTRESVEKLLAGEGQ